MMYLRKEDLKKANDDLREFILKTLPGVNPLSIKSVRINFK